MAHYVFPAATPAQPAAAYPVAQTAYVAAAPQAAYATAAPRAAAQAYADSYQTHAAAPQYAYTTRTQVAVTPTVTYDQKAYYQPAAAPTAAAAAAAAYSAAETQYQAAAAKPVYSATASFAATQQRLPQPKVTPVQVTTATATYVYSPATTPAVTTYAAAATPAAAVTSFVTTAPSSYSSYDAALYTAATNYYQQQQTGKTTATWGFKKTNNTQAKPKPKMPPKPPQLHYCDVCKISCAGPQTYREHLEGQKHKKKEAAMKSGEEQKPPSGRAGQNQLRCELCDVTCTGADAYAAHIRGAKHQKVLKLHTKLGKPIPSTDPVVLSAPSTASSAKTTTTAIKTTTVSPKPTPAPAATTVTKKVLSTPKITFVGGTQLKSTGQKLLEEAKAAAALKTEAAGITSMVTDTSVQSSTNAETVMKEEPDEQEHDQLNILGEKDVTPVGHEYIEEVKNEVGKIISFQCKLCECKFNDPNAKEMHMKGRRHRLQYKKKVDPKLQVDVKPSLRARKIQEEKVRRQAAKEEYWRRQQEERWRDEMRMEEEFRRYHHEGGSGEFFEWQRMGGGKPGNFGMMGKKPDSSDDKHVMAKHAAIYPNETELQAVQSIVSSCEKALKLVSDYLSDLENKDDKSSRALKGVMRVGVLAKGLLLHGDLNVHLVVLCADKPTRTTLMRLADNLPKQLAIVSEDKYTVRMCVEEAGLIVGNIKEPKTTCTITLTSPVMRDTSDGEIQTVTKDPPDVLDRQKCLRALAALRHAKWFQARANGLQSCVVVIRIMRDLCQRVPTWTPIGDWAMELLAEKCVSSGGVNMSPGDALRRVFECLASGILLPGGPGLHDPCEKEITDSTLNLTPQQREDITASAQHALRLIAFRQIHKVLGMDPLPPPKFVRKFNPRKRRHTGSGGDGQDGVGGEKTIKISGGTDAS